METEFMDFKTFVKEHVPYSELKKVGFFPKEIKFNDYEAITKRFLSRVGDKTMEEYINFLPELFPDSSFISGKFPDKVDVNGNFNLGGGFHLSLAARDFDIVCSICGCEQSVSISTSTWSANKKCRGCKRKIHITINK